MSLLDKAKELLHIGEHKEEAKEDEAVETSTVEFPNGTTIEFDKDPIDVIGDETVQPLNVDFWIQRVKAELYRHGISNDAVKVLEEGHTIIEVKVMEKHKEQTQNILTELLGDARYLRVLVR